jgi:hypothetical protein
MFGPKWKKYLSITEREKEERKRKSKQQLLKEKVVPKYLVLLSKILYFSVTIF